MPPDLRACVTDALRALDVRNLTVCVHDASFPSDAGEDIGRGSPCSRGGLRFLHFARALGFTGLQLGPDGQTPPDDPSPYRGAAFPRNTLSIALAPLAEDAEWAGLLPAEDFARAVAARPAGAREHAAHGQAREIQGRALRVAFDRLAAADRPLVDEQRRFERANAAWLERYELFEVLQRLYGTRDVRRWDGPAGDGLDARLWDGDDAARAARRRALRTGGAGSIAFFRFAQFVAQTQRRRFAAAAAELGLRLFADLPIGLSVEDEWCHPGLFLDGYRMGAPPSRTNPEGQAWGYPLFDPRRYLEPAASGARPGPVLRFLAARLDRMFAEVDGVRVDHPHGLVCPWVYAADARAVRDRETRPAESGSANPALRRRLGDRPRARTGGVVRGPARRHHRRGPPSRAGGGRRHVRGALDAADPARSRPHRARSRPLPRHAEGRALRSARRLPQRERPAGGLGHGGHPRHATDLGGRGRMAPLRCAPGAGEVSRLAPGPPPGGTGKARTGFGG
ncbi:MAG: hypothetical protein E6J75_18980 [Deltaproteobacteria bacterium]|nr:MAG: hypothetical protein E6J75_18980 [Deltaproteobacteria bacterium]